MSFEDIKRKIIYLLTNIFNGIPIIIATVVTSWVVEVAVLSFSNVVEALFGISSLITSDIRAKQTYANAVVFSYGKNITLELFE